MAFMHIQREQLYLSYSVSVFCVGHEMMLRAKMLTFYPMFYTGKTFWNAIIISTKIITFPQNQVWSEKQWNHITQSIFIIESYYIMKCADNMVLMKQQNSNNLTLTLSSRSFISNAAISSLKRCRVSVFILTSVTCILVFNATSI